ARLERYLQLCADYNMQVVAPSTPAQMFHLLRRQMLRMMRRPLIVMSPKSMLRLKDSASSLEELAGGKFQPVIGEVEKLDPKKVRRMIFCSGKVYYDLLNYRREHKITDMVIVRIEQLYPFPHQEFEEEMNHYKNANEVIWCQEEPGNQGAWHRVMHYLQRHMRPEQILSYALRPSSSSPAVGYLSLHTQQQKELVAAAFRDNIKPEAVRPAVKA
ncbi:MAG TPA: 2-oxoglutarate dehydrogenase E1 component, partial [Burkholderiales bacterium]|nr:2-oxoglutarate dehydrogenase E1 component [Burkholderiales bacterium]